MEFIETVKFTTEYSHLLKVDSWLGNYIQRFRQVHEDILSMAVVLKELQERKDPQSDVTREEIVSIGFQIYTLVQELLNITLLLRTRIMYLCKFMGIDLGDLHLHLFKEVDPALHSYLAAWSGNRCQF